MAATAPDAGLPFSWPEFLLFTLSVCVIILRLLCFSDESPYESSG